MNPDSPDAAANTAGAASCRTWGATDTTTAGVFRKQSLHPQAVELKTLLEELSELMRHSLPATLALEIEAQSPAWPAWIDISQLENAIINGDERP